MWLLTRRAQAHFAVSFIILFSFTSLPENDSYFQIINLISIIKENSQPSVSEVLDRILEILRNSELYFPADFPNRAFDPMLSDFVDGLVAVSGA